MNINYHNLWRCSIRMAIGAGAIGLSSVIANRLLQTSNGKAFAVSLLRNNFTEFLIIGSIVYLIHNTTVPIFRKLGLLHHPREELVIMLTADAIYGAAIPLAAIGNQAAAHLVTAVAVATTVLGLIWGTNYLIRHTIGVYNAIVHPRIPAPP